MIIIFADRSLVYTREKMHALPALYHSTEFGLTEAALAATCTTWRRMQRTTWKNGPRGEIELISSSWPTADPEAFPSATKSTTGCHVQSPNPAGQRWWFRWAFYEYQPGTAWNYEVLFLFYHHFYFPAELVGSFTLSHLLDKPWSQVSALLPPGTCLQF